MVLISSIEDKLSFTLLSSLSHDIPFWGLNIMYWLCTRFGWCQSFRLNSGKQSTPEAKTRALNSALFSTVLYPFLTYFLLYPILVQSRGIDISESYPSLWFMLAQIALCFLINDTLFYWAHRLLH